MGNMGSRDGNLDMGRGGVMSREARENMHNMGNMNVGNMNLGNNVGMDAGNNMMRGMNVGNNNMNIGNSSGQNNLMMDMGNHYQQIMSNAVGMNQTHHGRFGNNSVGNNNNYLGSI